MRGLLTSALVVAAAVAVLGQQPPTFRSTTRIVPVLTTVTDATGRLVPDLEKEDFAIFDDNKPQEIVLFENTVQPFTAVVMLDFSGSMTAHLELLKQGTEQFLLRLLPVDKAQVGAFSDKIMFNGRFTNDRDELIASLDDLQYGNPTRLYDAIDESVAELKDVEGRKVVVVFTDGEDTASKLGFNTVRDRAQKLDVMVYGIGLRAQLRGQSTAPDRNLRRLAEQTGGGYFELRRTADLGPTFTRVAQELRALYTLGFTPATLDGKEHRIRVTARDSSMKVRARTSYVATPDGAS
jgi:Ca-activated chloride channel family protein